jgi:GNAT superfamily N-acetyltransferase
MKIVYLKDHPAFVPQLANWSFTTWGHYNPGGSVLKAQQKWMTHLNDNSLPLTLLALDEDKPIGMCSLRVNDGIRPSLSPWLGSLFVVPEYRGQGIGEKLIEATIQKTKSMGYANLFLLAFDSTLPTWYQKLGWTFIGMDELHGYPVSVMEKKFEASFVKKVR